MAAVSRGVGRRTGDGVSAWYAFCTLAAVVVAGAAGLAPVWQFLHGQWTNMYGPFSHGYLTLGMSGWLAWRGWQANPPGRLAPDWRGAAPLGVLMLMLVGMALADIDGSRALLVPLVLVAVAWVLFGLAAAKRLALPAAFLYFAIAPVWLLEYPLQMLAAGVVGQAVSATGITAYIEGEFIYLPAGVFEIAGACSGVSYFIAGLTLAGFYALMYLRGLRSRLLLFSVAGIVAIASNWVRIYALVLIGHFTDMQHRLVEDHYSFGWVVFVIMFFPVLVFARRLEIHEIRSASNAAVPALHQSGAPETQLAGKTSQWLLAGVGAALLLCLPLLANQSWSSGASAETAGDARARLASLERLANNTVVNPLFIPEMSGR